MNLYEFRNNHFSTIFKKNGELFILVTDQGYLNQVRKLIKMRDRSTIDMLISLPLSFNFAMLILPTAH